jgi:hypothetical protein
MCALAWVDVLEDTELARSCIRAQAKGPELSQLLEKLSARAAGCG